MGTILVGALVFAAFAGAVAYLVLSKKKRKKAGGCPHGCAGCAYTDKCE